MSAPIPTREDLAARDAAQARRDAMRSDREQQAFFLFLFVAFAASILALGCLAAFVPMGSGLPAEQWIRVDPPPGAAPGTQCAVYGRRNDHSPPVCTGGAQ